MKIKLGLFREKITYLLFFGCLFCASMYMFESYSGMVSSVLLLTLSVLIYLFNIKPLAKSQILNCLIILSFIMFSMVVNRSFASIDIRTVVIVISSYLVIQSFSYEDFLKKYTDCIMAIALFSIAVYFLYKVALEHLGHLRDIFGEIIVFYLLICGSLLCQLVCRIISETLVFSMNPVFSILSKYSLVNRTLFKQKNKCI